MLDDRLDGRRVVVGITVGLQIIARRADACIRHDGRPAARLISRARVDILAAAHGMVGAKLVPHLMGYNIDGKGVILGRLPGRRSCPFGKATNTPE